MTGMSQKHAVAIFITSFFAGLLATVLLVEPQDTESLQTPFFGFSEEEIKKTSEPQHVSVTSTARPKVAAQTPTNPIPKITDAGNVSTSAKTVVGSHRSLIPPRLDPTIVLKPPAARADLPLPIPLSREEIGSLEELARRVDQQPAKQTSVSVTAFRDDRETEVTNKTTNHITKKESERISEVTSVQGRAEKESVDGEQIESISDQQTPNTGTIRPIPTLASTTQALPTASQPSSESIKQESPEAFDSSADQALSGKEDVPPEEALTIETHAAAPLSAQTAQTEPVAAAPTRATRVNSEPPHPEPARTASQGHVGKSTVVESPDSLRALVSRTQPENQTKETIEPTDLQPGHSATEIRAAEQLASKKVKNAAARSHATARGLESAAAALERAEQKNPVKSLLTRTLGPPAPATSEKRQVTHKITPKQASTAVATKHGPPERSSRLDLARENLPLANTDDLPYPKHWDSQPAVSLTPRHPRPRTETAPSPPLRTDLIGSSFNQKSTTTVSNSTGSTAGESWIDPDRDEWTKAVTTPPVKPAPPVESPRERIVKRLSQNTGQNTQRDAPAAPAPPPDAANSSKQGAPSAETPVKRLIDRLRPNERLRDRFGQLNDQARVDGTVDGGQTAWPPPTALLRQLNDLAAEASPRPSVCRDIQKWIVDVTNAIEHVRSTRSLVDDGATAALSELANCASDGMLVAGGIPDADLSSQVRRVAFAVKRRAATWQATQELATANRSQLTIDRPDLITAELTHLLTAIESFEIEATAPQAALIRQAMTSVTATNRPGNDELLRVITNQYAAPNVRLSLRDQFLTRFMPEATSRTEALNEMILGRQVRGRRVVEQTTSIQLTPDTDEICFDLVVDGQLSTYGITDAGPISMTSRGAGQFTVRKPIKVSQQGLLVGPSKASASNRARLMNISTSFDSVPLMGSMLRALAKNQHADNLPEANREVAQKIVWQSCRECDQESEKKFAELSARIEEKVWNPLVRLGLQPASYMQTNADTATLRLRLHADTQLAAHTPRPREPTGTLMGFQIHQSALNNAFDRLGIGGQKLSLEALFTRVQERMGIEPKVPEDLPEGVNVTFEAVEPVRVEFVDGLVNVRVSIDALESGRRDWYDVIGQVNYKPVAIGNRVLLERDGPIRISGPGHRGRIEFALRTIFGKIFPKERPLVLLPEKITDHPGTQDLAAVQAVSWDGWLALALAEPAALQTANRAETQKQR